LRDEKLAEALDAHAARVKDTAVGEAASAVFESTGEPGAGASATGTTMYEAEPQRIIDRAALKSAPVDLHPLAYRDRHGYVHLPLDATVELSRAFAAAEPATVIGHIDDQEDEMRLRGNEPGERWWHSYLRAKAPGLRSRDSGRASSKRPRCFARRSRACGRLSHVPHTTSSTPAPKAKLDVCSAPSTAGSYRSDDDPFSSAPRAAA